jgi:hypothetical protein
MDESAIFALALSLVTLVGASGAVSMVRRAAKAAAAAAIRKSQVPEIVAHEVAHESVSRDTTEHSHGGLVKSAEIKSAIPFRSSY